MSAGSRAGSKGTPGEAGSHSKSPGCLVTVTQSPREKTCLTATAHARDTASLKFL